MRLDLMGERKVKDSNLHAFISQCDATRARKVFSFSFIVHGCELAAVSNLAFATHIFFPSSCLAVITFASRPDGYSLADYASIGLHHSFFDIGKR